MSNFTLARPGQSNLTGGSFANDNALFLQMFSGEVMVAFDQANVAMQLHRVRTIPHGKSASFESIGSVTAGYHTPGTEINGQTVKHLEKVINIDDLLIASVAIANLDEAKLHYDVRGPYSKQCGIQLARQFDSRVLRTMILAARKTTDSTGNAIASRTLTDALMATDADTFKNFLIKSSQRLDELNVPESDRNAVLRPAQYYMLLQDTDVMNKQWGGSGSLASGQVSQLAGLNLIKSNNIPNSNVAAVTGENNTYSGDFTKTVALVCQKEAAATVKLLDLATEWEYSVRYQTNLVVSKYAMGHGDLRPEAAIELATP